MLSKDEILKRTSSGLDVFKHYIQGKWRVGRNFLNPLEVFFALFNAAQHSL